MNRFTKTVLLITAAILLFFNIVFAQDECITELTQAQVDYMNDTREEREIVDIGIFDSRITTIPVAAHIIRDSNGNGGLSEIDLLSSIKELNKNFTKAGFTFSLCTTNFIDNTDHFTKFEFSFSETSEEYRMAKPNLVNGAVNIFFAPNPTSSNGRSVCGWSSFPAYLSEFGKDWTVMNNVCVTNGSTLSHEIGHFFNLYHTHQGRSEGINVFQEELVDGSNCGKNVGDELCDTPAEPNRNSKGSFGISGCVSETCIYECNDRDKNNDLFTPNPSNLMSYSKKQCRNFLSPQQIERVQQSYVVDRFYLSNGCSDEPQNATCQATDRAALIALYNSTNGPNWKNKWDLATDHKNWYGVSVNAEGCVVGLNLYKNKLDGNLPPEIGNLTNLIFLKIIGSNLTGEIPTEMKNLINLEYIDFGTNNLEGEIPLEIYTLPKLDVLDMASNELSGEIPAEIKQLSLLKWLNLSYNKFEGEFPLELLSLPRLEIINLGSNHLTGTIPNEINILSNLAALYLHSNKFTGNIPLEIGDLVRLTHLYLGSNQLTGTFPKSFSNLTNLKSLLLNRNKLQGCYEPELKALCSQLLFSTLEPVSKLNNFDASWDDFCATDAGICNCNADKEALIALYNATNGQNWTNKWDLTTDHSTWHGVSVNDDGCVTKLELYRNNLIGSIPLEIGNLPKLEQLNLSSNSLIDNIPAEIGNLKNLQNLYLHFNELSGNIPTEIGNLKSLENLYLHFNSLSGNIPTELGRLNNLQYLYLNNNDLTGIIPIELGNLHKISTIGLYYNRLTGGIPGSLSKTSLARLFIYNNELSGCFPTEINNLCDRYNFKANDIDKGNNFDALWEDFCNTGAGACQSESSDFITGDYNKDGTVNHADAIYLGLSYGNTGTPCTTAEDRNQCPNWASEVNGVNAKFQDGDGNGIINEADLKAIEDNYGSTKSLNPLSAVQGNFSFKVDLVKQTSNEITFDLYVESQTNENVSTHGLACSIEIGELKVAEVKVDYTNSSLAPTITIDKFNPTTNTLDIAISRTDKVNKKCVEPVAQITITIAADIDTDGYTLDVAKVNSLDAAGLFSEGISSVFDSKDGSFKLTEGNAQVEYLSQNNPNPFSANTIITYLIPKNTKMATIKVYDLAGQLLQVKPIDNAGIGSLNINAKNLEAGLYLYTLEIDGLAIASKRMIIH